MFDVKMALSTTATHHHGTAPARGDWVLQVLMFLSAPWLFQPHRR